MIKRGRTCRQISVFPSTSNNASKETPISDLHMSVAEENRRTAYGKRRNYGIGKWGGRTGEVGERTQIITRSRKQKCASLKSAREPAEGRKADARFSSLSTSRRKARKDIRGYEGRDGWGSKRHINRSSGAGAIGAGRNRSGSVGDA